MKKDTPNQVDLINETKGDLQKKSAEKVFPELQGQSYAKNDEPSKWDGLKHVSPENGLFGIILQTRYKTKRLENCDEAISYL